MEGTKESELVTAILRYATRCLAEGDHAALRDMNFGPREIEPLREMNLADLYRIDSLRAHCLTIALNREVYWSMIEHLRRQRESEELQQTLIAADAPLEMMQTLFGLGCREYTRLRRTLAVSPSVGRPPDLDEQSTHTLWHAWSRHAETEETSTLPPETYLALHRETGIALRAIWTLTQRWSDHGDLGVPQGNRSPVSQCADG